MQKNLKEWEKAQPRLNFNGILLPRKGDTVNLNEKRVEQLPLSTIIEESENKHKEMIDEQAKKLVEFKEELDRQAMKIAELAEQAIKVPELEKQAMKVSELEKQAMKVPELEKQAMKIPALEKQLIQLYEVAKQQAMTMIGFEKKQKIDKININTLLGQLHELENQKTLENTLAKSQATKISELEKSLKSLMESASANSSKIITTTTLIPPQSGLEQFYYQNPESTGIEDNLINLSIDDDRQQQPTVTFKLPEIPPLPKKVEPLPKNSNLDYYQPTNPYINGNISQPMNFQANAFPTFPFNNPCWNPFASPTNPFASNHSIPDFGGISIQNSPPVPPRTVLDNETLQTTPKSKDVTIEKKGRKLPTTVIRYRSKTASEYTNGNKSISCEETKLENGNVTTKQYILDSDTTEKYKHVKKIYVSSGCVHVIAAGNRGFITVEEFIKAFSRQDIPSKSALFKIFKLTKTEISLNILERLTNPELFSELDRTSLDVPRDEDNRIKDTLYLLPIESIPKLSQILDKFAGTDRNYITQSRLDIDARTIIALYKSRFESS